eukprot:TRINITY_DN50497_c0_g1_i1.p1 TRINITY_DN50497_c0_g1~~TRINITY_DN50497_c0_g1_i1.p1  ORF type:complete len:546 (+),score=204.56 TRINITY_DN50497_c0_g1_i1:46-1638(+)
MTMTRAVSARFCSSAAGAAASRPRPVLSGLFQGAIESRNLYPYPHLANAPAAAPASQARTFEKLGQEEGQLSAVVSDYYQSCVRTALELAGSEEQKAALQGKVAAYCLTEEGAGTDASACIASATLSEDGESYVLNGTKTWVVNAELADYFFVYAKAKDANGKARLASFLVKKEGAAGIVISEPVSRLGLDKCSIASVSFQDCKIPKTALVGDIGSAHSLSLSVNSASQYRVAAALVGVQKRVLANVIEYSNKRKAFGRQLRELPLVKQRIANITLRIYATESMLYKVADMLQASGRDSAEVTMESALLKVFVGDETAKTVEDAMGILGAAAYESSWLEVLMRDVAAFRNIGGTPEINTLQSSLGGCEVGAKALKGKSTMSVIFARTKRSFGSYPVSVGAHASLKQSSTALDKLVSKFGSITEQVLIKFGKRVMDQQMVVRRMSEASSLLYSMGLVLSRASLAADVGHESAQHEAVLATTWCKHAGTEAETILAELSNVYRTTDTNMSRISDHVCMSGAYWPTHPCDVNV